MYFFFLLKSWVILYPGKKEQIYIFGKYIYIFVFQSLNHVWLFYDPMDCSLPGSSVHGIAQASPAGGFHFLFQGIFLTQGLNLHLLLGGWTVYHWATQEALKVKVLVLLTLCNPLASLVAQILKSLPTTQKMRVQSLSQEDPLEKEMSTHSSVLAWRIPWTEVSYSLWGHKESDTHKWLTQGNPVCIYVYVFVYLYLCEYMHAKSLQSRLTLCDPMDCSPPGSSVHH